jgi:hypothetical protein
MLPLSATPETPSDKVPPAERAPPRRPSARGRAGEVGGCTLGRRLREGENELFRLRRSLIELLKL